MNISYLILSLKENVQTYFDHTDICMFVALSTHYLVLTSLAWMLVEAINMHQLLITVFATSETRFMMKRMLFAWGKLNLFNIFVMIHNAFNINRNHYNICINWLTEYFL